MIPPAGRWRFGLLAIPSLLVLAGLAAGCSSAAAGSAPDTAGSRSSSGAATSAGGSAVTIDARSLKPVGKVLVNSQGYALYMFQPDQHRQVTCTGLCAATWPPVKIAHGAKLSAGPGVQASLLGTDPDPAGGDVVTYDGWPLYTYSGDVQPGQVTGQAIDLNGGDWYLMRPSGQPLSTGPQ